MAEAIAGNTKHRCEAPHCFRSRHRVGRYCKDHAVRYWESGHPVSYNIGRRMWRPFVRQAETFVGQHLMGDHAAIAAALRWITRELEAAKRPTRFDNPAALGYWSALSQVRQSGIEATELLARWIAGELADDRYTGEPGPRFVSDTHAAHQRARLLLYTVPLAARTWAKRKVDPEGSRVRIRPTWRVRAYAFERWNSVLGLLALKAAKAIRT